MPAGAIVPKPRAAVRGPCAGLHRQIQPLMEDQFDGRAYEQRSVFRRQRRPEPAAQSLGSPRREDLQFDLVRPRLVGNVTGVAEPLLDRLVEVVQPHQGVQEVRGIVRRVRQHELATPVTQCRPTVPAAEVEGQARRPRDAHHVFERHRADQCRTCGAKRLRRRVLTQRPVQCRAAHRAPQCGARGMTRLLPGLLGCGQYGGRRSRRRSSTRDDTCSCYGQHLVFGLRAHIGSLHVHSIPSMQPRFAAGSAPAAGAGSDRRAWPASSRPSRTRQGPAQGRLFGLRGYPDRNFRAGRQVGPMPPTAPALPDHSRTTPHRPPSRRTQRVSRRPSAFSRSMYFINVLASSVSTWGTASHWHCAGSLKSP